MKIKLPRIYCWNPKCGHSFKPRVEEPEVCPRCGHRKLNDKPLVGEGEMA